MSEMIGQVYPWLIAAFFLFFGWCGATHNMPRRRS